MGPAHAEGAVPLSAATRLDPLPEPVESDWPMFRDDLERHPRNPRSLFGLHESLIKQGKESDAALVQQAFDETWKNADVRLSIETF